MITQFIDHRLLDLIIFLGVVYSCLGFLYLTYELFGKNKKFKQALRVITPILLGVLVLAPIGVLTFAIYAGPLFNGAIEYGLIGGLIGAFNGIFVQWPTPAKRPDLFLWPCGLIGLILSAFVWFVIILVFNRPLVNALEIVGILSLIGGITGGLWSFLSWEPPPSPNSSPLPSWSFLSWESPPFPNSSPLPSGKTFSWKRSLGGLEFGFVLGVVLSFVLGSKPVPLLVTSVFLSLSGGIVLGFSRFPPPWRFFVSWRSSAFWQPFVSWWSSIPHWPSAFWRSFVSWWSSVSRQSFASWWSSAFSTAAATGANPCLNKPPLFSARGCVLGLFTALLLGLLSSLAVEIAFGNPLVISLRATLNGVSIIMPAGAIIGGFSRYIFWWAECLDQRAFLGWGAAITLFGFLFQLVPPLLDFIGIQPK